MKRMNKLLRIVTITSLAVSFVSFGIAVIGGLIDNPSLILFWYLGIVSLWTILIASVVASVVFLFGFGSKQFQQYFYRLKAPPHAAT